MKLLRRCCAVAALLAFTGGAYSSDCYVDDDTNAVSVQQNAGQGSFTCEDSVVAADGKPVTDLYAAGAGPAVVVGGTINKTLEWSLDLSSLPEGQTYPVYLVRVLNAGEGQSCNYSYDGITTSDDNLGNTSAGQVRLNQTLVCGSLQPVALPVEEEPVQVIDTVDQACETNVVAGNTNLGEQQATFGYFLNPDGSRRFSACGNTEDAGGLNPPNTPTSGQVACTPPEYVAQTPGGNCTPTVDGELPLSCAPVNIDAAPADGPEYCWFYENKVCRGGSSPDPAYCFNESGVRIRPAANSGIMGGSYINATLKDSVNAQFNAFEGSTCITQIFYGVAYHTCW